MTWRWHIFGGCIAYGAALLLISCFYTVPAPAALLLLGTTLFGALFPDIDTQSTIRNFVYGPVFICAVVVLLLSKLNPTDKLIAMALGLLPLIVRHRGLFHSKTVLIAVPSILAGIGYYYFPNNSTFIAFTALFFIAGTLSHLALDNFRR